MNYIEKIKVGTNGEEWQIRDPEAQSLIKKAAYRNNLDNSDFLVNQRGQSSYNLGAWGGYCVDRWCAYANGGTVAVVSGGLSLSGDIYQPIQTPASWHGKVLTYAVKIDGVVYVCSGLVEKTGVWHLVANVDTAYGRAWFELEDNDNMFVIIQNSRGAATVEWAALYEGEHTLDTLPEYQPKGYSAELAECQRYYQYLWGHYLVGAAWSNNNFCMTIPTVPMRSKYPSIIVGAGGYFAADGSAYIIADSSMSYVVENTDVAGVKVAVEDTQGRFYGQKAYVFKDAYIHISADL